MIDLFIFKNLKFLRLNFLPEGWMGKNFACWNGFSLSKGEYLLLNGKIFTTLALV